MVYVSGDLFLYITAFITASRPFAALKPVSYIFRCCFKVNKNLLIYHSWFILLPINIISPAMPSTCSRPSQMPQPLNSLQGDRS